MSAAQLHQQTLNGLPKGFEVRRLGETGLAVVDNFCTAAEAEAVIGKAEPHLTKSLIRVNNKTVDYSGRVSETALVYGPSRYDPSLLTLMNRAALLVGLPYTNLEAVWGHALWSWRLLRAAH